MSDIFEFLHNFVSRPDIVLKDLIEKYNNWVYLFLFMVIFAETGLIVMSFLMPFLPGDALIFTIGMISAQEHLKIWIIIPSLIVAALLGDNLNYYVGRRFGAWILTRKDTWLIKKKHIQKASEFFAEHGKKAIIIARFVPVVRTIIPFICGTTKVDYKTFVAYSFFGAVLWVGLISVLGYALGQFEIVHKNLDKFIIGIIVVANLPVIIRLIKAKFSKQKTKEI